MFIRFAILGLFCLRAINSLPSSITDEPDPGNVDNCDPSAQPEICPLVRDLVTPSSDINPLKVNAIDDLQKDESTSQDSVSWAKFNSLDGQNWQKIDPNFDKNFGVPKVKRNVDESGEIDNLQEGGDVEIDPEVSHIWDRVPVKQIVEDDFQAASKSPRIENFLNIQRSFKDWVDTRRYNTLSESTDEPFEPLKQKRSIYDWNRVKQNDDSVSGFTKDPDFGIDPEKIIAKRSYNDWWADEKVDTDDDVEDLLEPKVDRLEFNVTKWNTWIDGQFDNLKNQISQSRVGKVLNGMDIVRGFCSLNPKKSKYTCGAKSSEITVTDQTGQIVEKFSLKVRFTISTRVAKWKVEIEQKQLPLFSPGESTDSPIY